MFFSLGSLQLALALLIVIGGATAVGLFLGRWARTRVGESRETVGVVQGTLLGFLGLLLAFGLSMAVGRYDNRRSLMVDEANDIGTAYLRAQMLAEPERSASLDLLTVYTDAAINLAEEVPDSTGFDAALAEMGEVQR